MTAVDDEGVRAMQLKTLLVALDGSDHARRAVELAADLAARHDAQVVLVSVLLQGEIPEHIRALAEVSEPPEPPLAVGGAYVPSELPPKVLRDISQKLIDQAREHLEREGVRDIEQHIEAGSPAKVILAQADYHAADMIVMGARGLGAVKGLITGSVSHKVQQLASCTVVTVR